MFGIFTEQSKYKKTARFAAMLWTLLILIGCFTPGKELPKVDVPLVDKWVHIALFGGFSLLWYLGYPVPRFKNIFRLFLVAVALGLAIELLQGLLTFLGRSMELMDAVADSLGSALGLVLCSIGIQLAKQSKTGNR
jgi:VanZ family protein